MQKGDLVTGCRKESLLFLEAGLLEKGLRKLPKMSTNKGLGVLIFVFLEVSKA